MYLDHQEVSREPEGSRRAGGSNAAHPGLRGKAILLPEDFQVGQALKAEGRRPVCPIVPKVEHVKITCSTYVANFVSDQIKRINFF